MEDVQNGMGSPELNEDKKTVDPIFDNFKIYKEGDEEYLFCTNVRSDIIEKYLQAGSIIQILSSTNSIQSRATILKVSIVNSYLLTDGFDKNSSKNFKDLSESEFEKLKESLTSKNEDTKQIEVQYLHDIKIYIDPIGFYSKNYIWKAHGYDGFKNKYFYSDWREIIYQMAMDYYELGNTDQYIPCLGKFNEELSGKLGTGYEAYYTDIMGFWPEIYRSSYAFSYTYVAESNTPTGQEEYKYKSIVGWNQELLNHPEEIPFWLDFIDHGEIFDRFNVKKIGHRPIVKNDTKVKVILSPAIPSLILYYNKEIPKNSLYTPIAADTIKHCVGIAPYPKSAQSVMDQELSRGTVYARSLNLSMVPTYSYDVNKTIKIDNNKSQINGEFIVTRLSYSLEYNGMMSLQASELSQELL